MNSKVIGLRGLLALLALAWLVPVNVAAAEAELPPLPPLTDPASNEYHIGKFVWADLFTNDIARSRAFYEELFGWQFRWISEPPNPYGIFSAHGLDLAGIAYRDVEGEEDYGRWVHYVSVPDVADAEKLINDLGGRSLLRRMVAERGEFAIFGSPAETLFGVMRSSSGDPPDDRSLPGEWIWRQLYTWNLPVALDSLSQLAGYDLAEPEDTDEVDAILVSDGYARAGVKQLAADSDEAPTWLGFVRVEDVTDTVARASALGGEIYYQAEAGDLAIIADPEGGLIGVLEYQYPDTDESEVQLP
jgi:predicted enzyme related to lactoylglutathione lyase